MTAPAVPPLLLAGVSVVYAGAPTPALRDVTLNVAPGEGVALLGPNGAGKTTLLRTAMALLRPTSGVVAVMGRDTRRLAPEDLADVAGYLFQYPEAQLFERTVREEIAFGPRQLGWAPDRIRDATATVLEELALTPTIDTHPYDLPAPRRRLVALAATLVSAPRLLLLDEPTTALDRAARELVARVVTRRRAAGVAVVAVTHDAGFATEALDRALVLEAGAIAADAPLEAVLGTSAGIPALPPHAELARALHLPVRSLRLDDVARALSERCRAGG
ncbi:MAG: ABC transporter ATP-binding protein [Gemmatimonadota bacterium]